MNSRLPAHMAFGFTTCLCNYNVHKIEMGNPVFAEAFGKDAPVKWVVKTGQGYREPATAMQHRVPNPMPLSDFELGVMTGLDARLMRQDYYGHGMQRMWMMTDKAERPDHAWQMGAIRHVHLKVHMRYDGTRRPLLTLSATISWSMRGTHRSYDEAKTLKQILEKLNL